MIGYSEEELRNKIVIKGLALIPPHEVPDEQKELYGIIVNHIEQRAKKLARTVVEAIVCNNKRIEDDLRKAGVTIKKEELPAD